MEGKRRVPDSASQFPKKFLLIQPVLEGFAAIDEDDGDFVGELAAQAVVGFNINFMPMEAAAALEFGEFLLHDFAKVASLAGIHYDLTKQRHARESSKVAPAFPEKLAGRWPEILVSDRFRDSSASPHAQRVQSCACRTLNRSRAK